MNKESVDHDRIFVIDMKGELTISNISIVASIVFRFCHFFFDAMGNVPIIQQIVQCRGHFAQIAL